MPSSRRSLPRPFNYPWGSGQIVEEAAYSGQHHEAVLQLLVFDGEEGAGGESVRFSFYNLGGRFQRTPLLVGRDELDGLRAALDEAPRLRALIMRLVQDPDREVMP